MEEKRNASRSVRAGRTLPELLRQAPDRMLRILEEGDLSRTLAQLQQAEAPAPEWVRAKAGTLRLKYGAADAALRRLEEELRAALADRESAAPDESPDEARTDGDMLLAQTELTLRQIEAKRTELRGMRKRMTDLIALANDAEQAAAQADLQAALAQLRRRGRGETE